MNRRVMLTLMIVGIPLLLGFTADMVQKWDHVFDDAFITYRYAKNLADGHGITWNPGMAPTEGYTNFLLVIFLAPFIDLGYDPLLVTRLLSYFSVFGMAVILFARAKRRYGATTPTAIMIASLILLAPSTSALCLTGLETVVYALVLLVAFHFAVEFLRSQDTTNSVLLGIFTMLAILLRPEAALLYFVMAFVYGIILVRKKQLHRFASLTPSLLILLILGGVYLGWKALHFEQLLPNSFYIKVATGAVISKIGLVSVYHFLSTHTLLSAVFCVSLLFCLSHHDRHGRSDKLSVLLGLGLMLSYAVFFIKTDTHMDVGSRFMYPLVPVLIYSSIPVFTTAMGEIENWIKERAVLFPVLVVAFMLAFGSKYSTKIYGNVKRLLIYPYPSERSSWLMQEEYRIAKTLSTFPQIENVRIAFGDAGVIPYFTGAVWLDVIGLNDTFIARTRKQDALVDYFFRWQADLVIKGSDKDHSWITTQGPLGDHTAWAGDPRWDEYSYIGTSKVDKWYYDLQYFVRKSSQFAQPLTDFLRARIINGWYAPMPFHIGSYSPDNETQPTWISHPESGG
ncbi:hypothetical protein [Candidatus Thiosymbion oneisti]|uniref:hypothetical protein n=1 Tax=Candidatus Thiosymbion oneisti TaxID=589554 RepID=UPI00114CD041|nr:hypothetical protein [Candidatus Thiosymbion oneisti]